ncbi:MAG: ParA family protein [Prevotella sp.]|nr:ParA family protein [Prevotella sp.]MCF0209076.1 ParA family protein [Bacteroidaceae bacterium]MCF0243430.1 ParA family protein [Bacteroidaceae bacterium]
MDRLKEVLAFVNNKGGVAKTTTVQNTAAGLLRKDKRLRVLCIDLDPQGNLSSLLGWRKKQDEVRTNKTIKDSLMDADNPLYIYKSREGLYYCPASPELAQIDPALHSQMNSKLVLCSLFGNKIFYMDDLYGSDHKDAMCRERYVYEAFDYILIDCAPALSELTYNALGAATGVIIPVQLGSLSVDGIPPLIQAYKSAKKGLNKELELRGLLMVMCDERTRLAKETIDYVKEQYGCNVFKTRIRQCVRVGESQFQHQDIFQYSPYCKAGIDYMSFVEELMPE